MINRLFVPQMKINKKNKKKIIQFPIPQKTNGMSFKYLPTNDPWEVSHSNIELKDELSTEAFGQVWKRRMDLNVPKSKQSAVS